MTNVWNKNAKQKTKTFKPKETKQKYSTLVGKLGYKTLEVMGETNVTQVFAKIADAVLENYDVINETDMI